MGCLGVRKAAKTIRDSYAGKITLPHTILQTLAREVHRLQRKFDQSAVKPYSISKHGGISGDVPSMDFSACMEGKCLSNLNMNRSQRCICSTR